MVKSKTLSEIKCIDEMNIAGKVVFIRVDFNTPMVDGKISDDTRIRAALPTIEYAINAGAKVVLGSHFGRPKGKYDKKYSLEPVADRLSELSSCEVLLVEEPTSEAPKALLKTLKPKQILLLENLRFDPSETANGSMIPDAIKEYADIYINDAFGASHRAHSSIVAMAHEFPQRGIGFLMKKEVEMLDKVLHSPDHPFVAIIGGAKVSDKIEVMEALAKQVDVFIIGGAMAYTFLKAMGKEVGTSLVEKDKLTFAKNFLERMSTREKTVLLPVDHVIAESFNAKDSKTTEDENIPEGFMALDIGPKSVAQFGVAIREAKCVFWNGPMGVFENPLFAKGTFGIAKHVADNSNALTIVGGGDSVSAVTQAGVSDKLTHVSTGGGASLEYLEGKPLPGLLALRGKKIHQASEGQD